MKYKFRGYISRIKVRLQPICFLLYEYMFGVENFVYIYQDFMDCDKFLSQYSPIMLNDLRLIVDAL